MKSTMAPMNLGIIDVGPFCTVDHRRISLESKRRKKERERERKVEYRARRKSEG